MLVVKKSTRRRCYQNFAAARLAARFFFVRVLLSIWRWRNQNSLKLFKIKEIRIRLCWGGEKRVWVMGCGELGFEIELGLGLGRDLVRVKIKKKNKNFILPG